MEYLRLLIPKVKLLNKLQKKDILMLKIKRVNKTYLLNTVIRSSFICSNLYYFHCDFKIRRINEKDYLFTGESVSEGHPDKVCDRISDMVVDTYLAAEPQSRVACETLTTTNKVVLAAVGPEIKKEDLIEKVRHCIKDIGYDQSDLPGKRQLQLKVIYMLNLLILLWV